MRGLLKIGCIILLLFMTVVGCQYLGCEKFDILICSLMFCALGLFIFLFYESAIKNNRKIFAVIIVCVAIVCSFLTYKKNVERKNKHLVLTLIDCNKSLNGYRKLFAKLKMEAVKISEEDKSDNERKEKLEKYNKSVEMHNKKVDAQFEKINGQSNRAINILKKCQLGVISKMCIIDIGKFVMDFQNYKVEFDGNVKLLGNDKKKIEKDKKDIENPIVNDESKKQ